MGVEIKLSKAKRFWLSGGLIIFAGFLGYQVTDNFTEGLVNRYRPKLEKSLSRRFGHPLKIGQYQGLRPWGLSIGPSEFLEGPADNSSARVSRITIQIAPIESLFNRRPVAILTPIEAKLNLRENGTKPLWIFGKPINNNLPIFDVRLRLDESSRIFLEPSNLQMAIDSDTLIKLSEKKVNGSFKFNLFDRGSLTFKGNTHWNKFKFDGFARIKDLNLATLNDLFLKQSNFESTGIARGDIKLSLQNGRIDCKGKLNFKDINLKQLGKDDALAAKDTSISCRHNNIEMSNTEFEYGPWSSLMSGTISLKEPTSPTLNLKTLIRLTKDPSSELNLDASLPFLVRQDSLDFGELSANIDLKPFNLAQLKSITGLPLAGKLAAKGTLKGPLKSLNSDISLAIDNPKIGAARLQEKWRGSFKGSFGSGAELRMSPIGAAVPGNLLAKFKPNWTFNNLSFSRLDGQINIRNSSGSYDWDVNNFRLDRIELSSFLEKSFKRIFGKIIGKGKFKLNPFFIDGDITYTSPRYLGLQLREATIKGSVFQKNYSITSELLPPDNGQISISAEGKLGGRLWTKAVAKNVSPSWLSQSVFQLTDLNNKKPIALGRAKDLKGLSIDQSESLDSQLRNWVRSVVSVDQNRRLSTKQNLINPRDLKGFINGVVELNGTEISKLKIDLKASGKVWLKNQKNNVQEIKPFNASFKGPLRGEGGDFSLVNVPFSLLSLFVQVPSSLTGMIGIKGKYRLKNGSPEVTADLVLTNGLISESSFVLERGKIWASTTKIQVDISVRARNSTESVKVYGQIPLTSLAPFDLRIESHGDGLNFLDGLSDGLVTLQSGSSDLRLFIRGTLEKPIANGFLVVRDSDFSYINKDIKNFNTRVVFDFNRLEVMSLSGDIDSNGKLYSKGAISLFGSQSSEPKPLLVDIEKVNIERDNSSFKLSSKLILRGSIVKPIVSGDVFLEKGLLSIQRYRGASNNNLNTESSSQNNFASRRLPEQSWDRSSSLDLFIQNRNSSISGAFKPNFADILSSISFDNLKLNLGEGFRIVSQPIASFNAEGFLILNGPLDETLQLKGLVSLKNGRVNLFTTTFTFDKREPNVAIFAPATGFIPFIDLKMIARVSDTIKNPNELASTNDLALNGSGIGSIGGSRLVRVEISATGPADRLEENFQIRSRPPLPRNQLLNLIGGNSLTMLFGGSQSDLVANVLNRSFVSPLLGNISGTLSERIQFSVYPAFVRANDGVNEDIQPAEVESNNNSEDLSPQQAWVTEMGIDLTDRVNFSIQVTPNRDDIPPQSTVTYQFNSNLGVLGSLDKNGNWQSEFQIYLRY